MLLILCIKSDFHLIFNGTNIDKNAIKNRLTICNNHLNLLVHIVNFKLLFSIPKRGFKFIIKCLFTQVLLQNNLEFTTLEIQMVILYTIKDF